MDLGTRLSAFESQVYYLAGITSLPQMKINLIIFLMEGSSLMISIYSNEYYHVYTAIIYIQVH